jgi:hypothetical protein
MLQRFSQTDKPTEAPVFLFLRGRRMNDDAPWLASRVFRVQRLKAVVNNCVRNSEGVVAKGGNVLYPAWPQVHDGRLVAGQIRNPLIA